MKSSKNNLMSCLRLIRTKNVGPKTFLDLVRIYGSVENAIENLPELAQRGGVRNFKLPPVSQIEQEINANKRAGSGFMTIFDEIYPSILRSIDSPPIVLNYLGNLNLIKKNVVAVVGARNSSANGEMLTRKFVSTLGESDFVIASGMARGIDSAAHSASLDTGTIAVLAGGVDVIYPPENQALYKKIKDTGLIVAEMPLTTVAKQANFPQRNRIISGISHVVVVIEASIKSGSLITARTAADQGRPVCVVPGFPLDARYRGNNLLIKEGAILIESANDIIDAARTHNRHLYTDIFEKTLDNEWDIFSIVDSTDLCKVRELLLKSVSTTPIGIEDLRVILQVPTRALLIAIVELELMGRVQRHAGNKISLIFTDVVE